MCEFIQSRRSFDVLEDARSPVDTANNFSRRANRSRITIIKCPSEAKWRPLVTLGDLREETNLLQIHWESERAVFAASSFAAGHDTKRQRRRRRYEGRRRPEKVAMLNNSASVGPSSARHIVHSWIWMRYAFRAMERPRCSHVERDRESNEE